MRAYSSNTKRFLYAAKLAEITALEQLSANCHLVTIVCKLIHEFQKERGVSNVYLASIGIHYPKRRILQIQDTEHAQQCMLDILKKDYLESKQNNDNHRLLFSITRILQLLDSVNDLRNSVEQLKLSALESTKAYCRIVESLLSVIYEAADLSSDTKLAHQLLALFNFIQAKEYAGQERAWGAIGFAESRFTEQICTSLSQLQASQNSSIEVFLKYTDEQHQHTWDTLIEHKVTSEITTFRRLMAQLSGGEPVSPEISEVWYELVTQRIDQMHIIESSLLEVLVDLAKHRVKQSTAKLKSQNTSIPQAPYKEGALGSTLAASSHLHIFGVGNDEELNNATSANGEDQYPISEPKRGEHLQKSMYDLLLKQARRIEEMSDELSTARDNISSEKLLSRAKLLLIQQLKISENEAHQKIQKAAMGQGISLAKIAQNIISASGEGKTSVK